MLKILENEILAEQYQPNEKLPGIPTLAKRFGVSYGAAHAVIARLAEKRLVVIEHGRGTFVLGDRPIGIEWMFFTDARNVQDQLLNQALDYLRQFWNSEQSEKTTLNLNLCDVRNLQSPKTMTKINRDRAIRALLVSGHGRHYLDYVNELAKRSPVVSLFAHWRGEKISYIAPDTESLIAHQLEKCRAGGVKRIGFVSPELHRHPNYDQVHKETSLLSKKFELSLQEGDCFLGERNDAINWIIGRLSRPDPPKYWICSVVGHASAVLEAAKILDLTPGKDINVLTFGMLKSDYEELDGLANVGIHNIKNTVDAGIKQLLKMVWSPRETRDKIHKVLAPMEFLPMR